MLEKMKIEIKILKIRIKWEYSLFTNTAGQSFNSKEEFLPGGKNKKNGEENISDFYILDILVFSHIGVQVWLQKGFWHHNTKL